MSYSTFFGFGISDICTTALEISDTEYFEISPWNIRLSSKVISTHRTPRKESILDLL